MYMNEWMNQLQKCASTSKRTDELLSIPSLALKNCEGIDFDVGYIPRSI